MSDSDMSFVNVPEDTTAFGIKELMEALDGEDIYDREEEEEQNEERLETQSNPEIPATLTTPFISKTKDDLDSTKAGKQLLNKGRKPTPLPDNKERDDPFFAASKPEEHKKQKRVSVKTAPREVEDKISPPLNMIESPKELIVLINKLCKHEGILPAQVYQDLLIREMNVSDGGLSEKDVKMFLLGVKAEKMYSSQQVLKDTIQSLSQEVSKLVKIQKGLEESKAQMLSSYKTHEEKMIRSIRDELYDGFQSFKGHHFVKDEDSEGEGEGEEDDIPQETYMEAIDQPGPSNVKKYPEALDLLVPPELVEEFDISTLTRPPSAEIYLPVAVAELGLGEGALDTEEKRQSLLWGPTLKQKIILFNGMASDALKDEIVSSVGIYYKQNLK